MGLVKIPKSAIEFFKKNQDEIFNSGNLSEGPWIDKLSNKIKTIAGVKNAIPVNSNGSGLVALLLIFKEYFGRSEIMIQSNTIMKGYHKDPDATEKAFSGGPLSFRRHCCKTS